jgi:hypothetical protein
MADPPVDTHYLPLAATRLRTGTGFRKAVLVRCMKGSMTFSRHCMEIAFEKRWGCPFLDKKE